MISHSVACATFTRSTTTGDPRQNSSPSRNPGLDLLRFAAAAALAILYIRAATVGAYGLRSAEDKLPVAATFYFVTRLGGEAVIIFFVLSGYLIGGRNFTKIAQGKFDALEYGIYWAVRIGLPLIPALVFTACINSFLGGEIQALVFLILGTFVVSDGRDHELAELLNEPNVSRVDRGCAAADLWALSQARVILGSGGSTFTGWGSFLGGAPLALVPGQSLEWLGFHNHRDAWRGNVDHANAPELAAFCEAVKRAVDAASL